MKEELLNYYKRMMINTFPLTKKDIVEVIENDLYNRYVRGVITLKEKELILLELSDNK